MHGNPLFRVLILGVLLAVTGLIVAAVARSPQRSEASGLPVHPTSASEAAVAAVVGIQLSAPARSISLRSAEGTALPIGPLRPEDLSIEFRSDLAIRDRSVTVLLSVEWESPAPNRFVSLEIEPEGFATRTELLRAPDDLDLHAITFDWTSPVATDE